MLTTIPPDIEIARAATMLPIEQIAARLGIEDADLEHYGKTKAKVSLGLHKRLQDQPTGKLILFTALTPTPAGEGKTTTTIGLADAINRLGPRAVGCIREPSLGPCFGFKGGAAGGGYAQVVPHGCNSLIAIKLALHLADYTVTEAGFGADLGAEKFIDIKCRQAGLAPDAVVLVATVRALKMHGGVAKDQLTRPDPAAVAKGMGNLLKHIENIKAWGLPVVVAINHFDSDTAEEIEAAKAGCAAVHVKAALATHWAKGGQGALEVAREALRLAEAGSQMQFTYSDELCLWEKVRDVAQRVYGANDIMADTKVRNKFKALEEAWYGRLPVCIAKTQYSFSTDPLLRGRPKHFDVPIRDVAVSAGAGFVVVLTGELMTMPGLPKTPAAEIIDIDDQGEITGLS